MMNESEASFFPFSLSFGVMMHIHALQKDTELLLKFIFLKPSVFILVLLLVYQCSDNFCEEKAKRLLFSINMLIVATTQMIIVM